MAHGGAAMEMQQVRYFVALAKTLNFTRAAEQCNVSQPALTRAIQQLEHELGGPLFHRERGNTHLSELGRMMLPYLQTVEESCRAARDHARAVKKLERATLTIGTMCTIGPQLVSDLLIRFQAAHPNVEVRVIDAGAPQMLRVSVPRPGLADKLAAGVFVKATGLTFITGEKNGRTWQIFRAAALTAVKAGGAA